MPPAKKKRRKLVGAAAAAVAAAKERKAAGKGKKAAPAKKRVAKKAAVTAKKKPRAKPAAVSVSVSPAENGFTLRVKGGGKAPRTLVARNQAEVSKLTKKVMGGGARKPAAKKSVVKRKEKA